MFVAIVCVEFDACSCAIASHAMLANLISNCTELSIKRVQVIMVAMCYVMTGRK